jgi:hypothetical protein
VRRDMLAERQAKVDRREYIRRTALFIFGLYFEQSANPHAMVSRWASVSQDFVSHSAGPGSRSRFTDHTLAIMKSPKFHNGHAGLDEDLPFIGGGLCCLALAAGYQREVPCGELR